MATWAEGKDGKATFGGTTLNITSWTYSEAGTDADVTHTGSSGVELVEPTTTAYTGTIEANWDLDQDPTGSSPSLRRGDTGALQLYVSETEYIQVAVVITELSADMAVKEVISYSISWQGTAAPSTVPS
jgi:hypothetical protein